MLTHIVCWKYRSDVSTYAREDHRARLRSLVGVVPEIRSFDLGEDILNLERSFDTGLVSTFDDRESFDRYSAHPAHVIVAAVGRELSVQVVSVDFISNNK